MLLNEQTFLEVVGKEEDTHHDEIDYVTDNNRGSAEKPESRRRSCRRWLGNFVLHDVLHAPVHVLT